MTWIELHKLKLIILVVLAMCGGLGMYLWSWKVDRAEREVSGRLFNILTSQEREEEEKPEEILALAQSDAGTKAGELALLLAAQGYFLKKQFDLAERYFDQFRQDYPDSEFWSTALFGSASSLEAMGKTNEAKEAYLSVSSSFANTAIAAQSKLFLARINEEQENLEEAVRLYDELDRPNVSSRYNLLAVARREAIWKRRPDLRPVTVSEETTSGTVPEPGVSATNTVADSNSPDNQSEPEQGTELSGEEATPPVEAENGASENPDPSVAEPVAEEGAGESDGDSTATDAARNESLPETAPEAPQPDPATEELPEEPSAEEPVTEEGPGDSAEESTVPEAPQPDPATEESPEDSSSEEPVTEEASGDGAEESPESEADDSDDSDGQQ